MQPHIRKCDHALEYGDKQKCLQNIMQILSTLQ